MMEIQTTTPNTSPIDWQSQVTAWQESGLPMSRYCEQHGLVAHQLSYYKRKFQVEQATSGSTASGFSQVSLAAPSPGLTLQLSNGHLIAGISSENLPLLGELVQALA